MSDTAGFIGLGIMGRGMSRNLLRAGVGLTVWNRTPTRAEELAAEGAAVAESPAALARACDVIITCVSDTADVEQILFGESGVIEGIREGALVVDCSTISPMKTKEFAGRLREHGAHMIDAPVSGGSEGAEQGSLSIMAGGDEEQFLRAKPYLDAMGKTVTHVGGNGAGQMVKMVNQILVAGGMLAVSEAMVFAQAGGLDLEKTLQAVSGGAAGSWALSNRAPQMIRRDWRPGFTVDLQEKDLRLVLEAADELAVPLLSCSTASHFYRALQQRGLGGEGNHALVKALEFLSGIEVGTDRPDRNGTKGEK